jgi:UDP-glucose 4-epimerase
MTLNEAIDIYYPCYASHRGISLRDWLEARDIVKANPKALERISKEPRMKKEEDEDG